MIEDTGGGIIEPRLYHNGGLINSTLTRSFRVVGNSPDHPDAHYLFFSPALIDGLNIFEAVASSHIQTTTSVQFSLEYNKPVQPKLWILAVGIDDYGDKERNLNYAVTDAEGIVSKFEALNNTSSSLYSEIETRILRNSEAHKENVIREFNYIQENTDPNDVFIFFYAGHGIPLGTDRTSSEFYYVLSDIEDYGNPEQQTSAWLSGSEFAKLVGNIPARQRMYIIDACHSGTLAKYFVEIQDATTKVFQRLQSGTGSMLIAAARENEKAVELSELKNGALTYAVIEGLEGKGRAKSNRGIVDTIRLYLYVEDRVAELLKNYPSIPQTVQTDFSSNARFDIVRFP